MELFEDIRKARAREDVSIRALAGRYGVHRRTVRQALADPVPPARRSAPPRDCPVTGPVRGVVRGWLIADLKAPVKQRHTARRIRDRLVEEYGVVAADRTVRKMVAELRSEITPPQVAAVPQEHAPGVEAEADFGEFWAEIAGQMVKLFMFVLRLSASGKALCRAYANCAQEAFLDGHVRAFGLFGGTPERIRYDNLKPAVVQVMRGRDRREHDRFTALRSYYGFDSFFCQPGVEGAHEKGGVEGQVGFFRRNHLVPVPKAGSLNELNGLFEDACRREDGRRIGERPRTIGADFVLEAPYLTPLPASGPFEAVSVESRKVDQKARVAVRGSHYSVPVGLVGRRVQVKVGASEVTVLDGVGREVARHARAVGRGSQVLELDHYLETLRHRPGAFAGSAPLARARAHGVFTGAHQAWWGHVRRALGDQEGTRVLVEVLLGARRIDPACVEGALSRAAAAGWTTPEAVLIEARRLEETGSERAVRLDADLGRVCFVKLVLPVWS
jgi:transposase